MIASETVRDDGRPLAVISSVHGTWDGDGVILDRKALEGIEYRVRNWPGPIYWLMSFHDTPPSYSIRCDPASLPFHVVEVAPDRSDVADLVPRDAIVEASADYFQDFALAEALPGRVIYVLEYTLRTRLAILRLERRSPLRWLRGLFWELRSEHKRKRAIRAAAALHCNGLPALRHYGALARRTFQYFDTRLLRSMQIDPAALATKQEGIRRGDRLHLAFSGRLDRMKGVHHILPLIRRLRALGVDFTFEVFGGGALAGELEQAAAGELAPYLVTHGPVPFAEALVPAMKARIHIFICPHPQGDPSCTYMETLGCGVPIVGFANEAWASMAQGQDFGETVPVGDVAALAETIRALDADRGRLAAMAGAAAAFSADRTFEDVFSARLDQVRALSDQLAK